MSEELVEVKLLDVVSLITAGGRMPAILLEDDRERILPIIVGGEVALSLKSVMIGEKPLEDDIWTIAYNMINVHGSVEEAVIYGVKESRFLSYVTLKLKEEKLKVKCKPSDSVSLAVRAKTPIKVSKKVMDEYSLDKSQLKPQHEPS